MVIRQVTTAMNTQDDPSCCLLEKPLLLLSEPNDRYRLTAQLCFVREQLEVFAATPADVSERVKKGGNGATGFSVGRVGLRCIHCRHIPYAMRDKGSVTYPLSIRLVYQAVRNWQRYHLRACLHIPRHSKDRYEGFKNVRAHSSKESTQYWIDSCERLGMADYGNDGGIFFRDADMFVQSEASANTVTSGTDDGEASMSKNVLIVNSVLPEIPLSTSLRVKELDEDNTSSLYEERESEIKQLDGEDGKCHEREEDSLHKSLSSKMGHLGDEEGGNDGRAKNSVTNSNCNILTSQMDQPDDEEGSPNDQYNGGICKHSDARPFCKSSKQVLERVRLAHEIVKTTHELCELPSTVRERKNVSITERFGSNHALDNDLISLGVELYELFAGSPPFRLGPSNNGHRANTHVSQPIPALCSAAAPVKKREKRQANRAYVPLSDLGIPFAVCRMVSSLLDLRDKPNAHGYQSVEEVEEDLRQMTSDPERFLFDPDIGSLTGQLDLSNNCLYGRETQTATLMDAYNHMVEWGKREMVLISGYSGTGKSSLVYQAQEPFSKKGACFISGKFDERRQAQPLSTISAAFNEYCVLLLRRDQEHIDEIKAAILSAIGSEAKVLTDLIPNLSKVIGSPKQSSSKVRGNEAHSRLKFLFRALLGAIASPSHPIVLFLDDLQWADISSLELMKHLATDTEMMSVLFIGCYRDNEVGCDHPLMTQLREIEDSGVCMTIVKLENLSIESVNSLVSDALHLSPCLTKPLAHVVYNKSSGNCLFATQFIKALCDEGLLRYSPRLHRWEWSIDRIQSKDIADNVAELMMIKIRKLESEIQWGLRIAACLGAECTLFVLKHFKYEGRTDVTHLLAVAVDEGLMYKTQSGYKFSHDQIQTAAYSLTSPSQRASLHLQIGRTLCENIATNDAENFIFVAVDQLNCGRSLIIDRDEKDKLAQLNLQAGKKAIASSAFSVATMYLEIGTGLLDKDDDWDRQYFLCLDMYSSLAETRYVIESGDSLKFALEKLFTHARSFEDKLRAYYTLCNYLGAQHKFQDAIDKGLEVLACLGESFPTMVDDSAVIKDLSNTKDLLAEKTIDTILAYPLVVDKAKATAMKFLDLLFFYSYLARPSLFMLISLRMVRLSLLYGLSAESAYGFANYGHVLCSIGNDVEGGYRCGKLAISLLEKFGAKESLARVYFTVYGLVNCWKEPLQVGLPAHLSAYQVGMLTGDVHTAFSNITLYFGTAVLTGKPLRPLEAEIRSYVQKMSHLKQATAKSSTETVWQVVLNLIGCSEDPVKLSGEAMQEEIFLSKMREDNALFMVSQVIVWRMYLEYLFGEYKLGAASAAEYMHQCSHQKRRLLHRLAWRFTFYHGLIALSLLRLSTEGEWRSIALDAIKNSTTWAENSPWNNQHRVELLTAELCFVDGNTDKASKAYDDAISLAANHGFIPDEALACERAGMFHEESGSISTASEYYVRSMQCYEKWGATRKVSDIQARLDKL